MTKWPYILVALVVLAGAATANAATYHMPSEVSPEDQAWLDARGYSVDATVEISEPEPLVGKAGNKWHAKVTGVMRGCDNPNGDNHNRCVWAWNKSVLKSWGGQIRWNRQAVDRGTPGFGWEHGFLNNEHWQYRHSVNGHPARRLFSHYFLDFHLSRSCWALTLNMNQWWTRKVDRKAHWHHFACA